MAAALLAPAATLLTAGAAHADCKLFEVAEFHVDPHSRSPIVDGEINGEPVKVLFDTGSDFSMIPRHEAERLGLILGELRGVHAYGVGGESNMKYAQLKSLKIGPYTAPAMQLLVSGDRDVPSDVAIVLGDDFFAQADAEFDLPDNVVRLFQHRGCKPDELVYWGANYSQAQLHTWDRDRPDVETEALVNGKRILAEFDSGADTSVIDMNTAEEVGVTRAGAGPPINGFNGQRGSFIGAFSSFAVGDEKVRNVPLQVMDFKDDFKFHTTGSIMSQQIEDTPSMLIGADFFRAHRVYIDMQDRLILFSYSGGRIFAPIEAPAPYK